MIDCQGVLMMFVNGYNDRIWFDKWIVVFDIFYNCYSDNVLVFDKWFQVQVLLLCDDVGVIVVEFVWYFDFSFVNLNCVCVLIGVFLVNQCVFYSFDGSGYCFFVDQLIVFDCLNLQIVVKLLLLFGCWWWFDVKCSVMMCGELEWIVVILVLLKDMFEQVLKSLEG